MTKQYEPYLSQVQMFLDVFHSESKDLQLKVGTLYGVLGVSWVRPIILSRVATQTV